MGTPGQGATGKRKPRRIAAGAPALQLNSTPTLRPQHRRNLIVPVINVWLSYCAGINVWLWRYSGASARSWNCASKCHAWAMVTNTARCSGEVIMSASCKHSRMCWRYKVPLLLADDTFWPCQQNVDSRSPRAQCGRRSAFMFRLSGCFLSKHPVSHKARTLNPTAEARTIELRASHMVPSSTLIQINSQQ